MKMRRLTAMLLSLSLLLGVRNGYIALWRGDDPEPVRVFPYKASMLPKQDQLRLEAGITIGSYDELHSLLEDYLS